MDEPWDILRVLTATFSELAIEYMIVDSTAMRAYVPGRSTFDTDVLVKMTSDQLEALIKRFGEDWYLDAETARKGLAERRMFNAIHYKTSWKLDLIPLKDDEFHQTEFARRREDAIGDVSCYVQAPEDLVLSKLQWAAKGGSSRQVEDVRSLFVAGVPMDEAYVKSWSTRLGLDKLLVEARNG
ncbi:MAG: hypothetical protein H6839_11110 [Planctomycetes bacterium]|nr:hypothetical protein [Planctomycetota bacterium]